MPTPPHTPHIDPATGLPYPGGVPGPSGNTNIGFSILGDLPNSNREGSFLGGDVQFTPEAPPIGNEGGGTGGSSSPDQSPQGPLSPQQKQTVWDVVFKNCMARKELMKQLDQSVGASVATGCILGGVVGGVGGAFGGGFLAGPVGAVAGTAAGVALGFHEGCAIGAGTALFAETITGNIPQLRKLADTKAFMKKAEGECKAEADKVSSGL